MLSNGGMHGADDSGPMSMMQGDPNRNPKRPRGRERKSCAVCYSLKTKCNGDRSVVCAVRECIVCLFAFVCTCVCSHTQKPIRVFILCTGPVNAVCAVIVRTSVWIEQTMMTRPKRKNLDQ